MAICLYSKNLSLKILSQIGNCAIQIPVKQHRYFDEMAKGPVTTMRITTVRGLKGTIEYRTAYLKVGRIKEPSIKSSSYLRVGIEDQKTGGGSMSRVCFTPEWRQYKFHPDTGFIFEGGVIPRFKEAVNICIELHRSIPQITIIGWDVAIDDSDQVKLLEWNTGHVGIRFCEAVTGPCFTGLGWEQYRVRQLT